ncbi:MAG: hypothetical protein HC908_10465 [Calothrix sp. SM1_7_51]|nr:hypothetical protein [Calothrix sp. SM1_7_51]
MMISGYHQDSIIIETNVNKYQLPITLTIPNRWENIVVFSFISGLSIGGVMWLIRFLSSLSNSSSKILKIEDYCYLNNQIAEPLLVINVNQDFSFATLGLLAIVILLALRIRSFLNFISTKFNELTVHLFILFTLILTLIFITNGLIFKFLSVIGFSLFLMIDLIAYNFTWIRISTPSYGWFIIGMIIGVASGILPTLHRTKKDNYSWRVIILTLIVTMLVAGYLRIYFQFSQC